jgi:hypothetical protein
VKERCLSALVSQLGERETYGDVAASRKEKKKKPMGSSFFFEPPAEVNLSPPLHPKGGKISLDLIRHTQLMTHLFPFYFFIHLNRIFFFFQREKRKRRRRKGIILFFLASTTFG